MRVLIICDSFKGTLSSLEVGSTLKDAIQEYSDIDANFIPISDGGEGFLDVINANIDVDTYEVECVDALRRKNKAKYLFKNGTAYVELAEVVGIKDLSKDELDCFHANTYGLGLLIKQIIEKHCPKKIVMGLGGSASTDGGAGMLEALGAKYYQNDQQVVNIDNEKLGIITSCDLSKVKELTSDTEFLILTDVTNPLLGFNGAAYVFGRQKGASKEDLYLLNKNLDNFTNISKSSLYSELEGSGAAGGTGFGCLFGLNGKIESGIKVLLELCNFKELSKEYDYIITGEGKFDIQSKMGKVYQGIYTNLDKKEKLLVVCGISEVNDKFVFSIVPELASSEESLKEPKKYLKKLVKEKILKLYEKYKELKLNDERTI